MPPPPSPPTAAAAAAVGIARDHYTQPTHEGGRAGGEVVARRTPNKEEGRKGGRTNGDIEKSNRTVGKQPDRQTDPPTEDDRRAEREGKDRRREWVDTWIRRRSKAQGPRVRHKTGRKPNLTAIKRRSQKMIFFIPVFDKS